MNKSRAWIVELFFPADEENQARWKIVRTNNDRHATVQRRDRMILPEAMEALKVIWPKFIYCEDVVFRLRNVKNPDIPVIMADALMNRPKGPKP